MVKKIEIPAIHDKDIRKIFDNYGITEKIDEKKILCFSCNKIIEWQNISIIKVHSGNLLIYCDNPECIEKATNN